VGHRRERRLQRARHYRVGIAVVASVALLAGAITIFASTVDDDQAAAGTSAAAPAEAKAKTKQRPTVMRSHTVVKTAVTKIPPPPVNPFPPAPESSGTGRRVVYCNHCQRVWLIEENGWVFASYTVSGRSNYPRNGTYHVIRKVNPGYAKTLRLPYFVGFTYGNTTDVGFHGIPLRPNGTPIQSESQLGTPLSHGCVRESQFTAKMLWDWAPMGTTVVVMA
jgi:lipoprotein-anchoring transpeptidase ErfK/SrfK